MTIPESIASRVEIAFAGIDLHAVHLEWAIYDALPRNARFAEIANTRSTLSTITCVAIGLLLLSTVFTDRIEFFKTMFIFAAVGGIVGLVTTASSKSDHQASISEQFAKARGRTLRASVQFEKALLNLRASIAADFASRDAELRKQRTSLRTEYREAIANANAKISDAWKISAHFATPFDFSVYYSQGLVESIMAELKAGKSEVVCEAGQLVKVSKDKEGTVKRETLTKKWTDWVDYWAVDFDYESRKEIISRPKNFGVEGQLPGLADTTEFVEFEDEWTGSYIFENEWQSFRTRKDRSLELTSASHVYDKPGRYVVAVKVIDIFGNDTMSLTPVTVG